MGTTPKLIFLEFTDSDKQIVCIRVIEPAVNLEMALYLSYAYSFPVILPIFVKKNRKKPVGFSFRYAPGIRQKAMK